MRESRQIHLSATPGSRRARRGSVLIVALLVAALMALVLGSYLSLNLGTARLAQRTFDRGAAFHLAEAGLEEGLWTYNRLLAGETSAWDEWSSSEDHAWRRIDGFRLTASTRGEIKLYASPLAPDESSRPTLVALASVSSPGGAPVTQMIETTLRRRSFFAAGLVAREKLVFIGRNTTFDSWDSDPDGDAATPARPYSPEVAEDVGSIATGAVDNTNVTLNQARIHGYFFTAGLTPAIGSTGFIGPFGVSDGVIDPDRFSQNFHANFPRIAAPEDGGLVVEFGATLGTLGQSTTWHSPQLVLKGSSVLTILGDVTLVLTDSMNALSISGKAGLLIPPGSSLTLHAQGDVLVAGKGLANTNPQPAAFQFWSTAGPDRPQTVDVRGNGAFSGVLYAPEAAVTVNGNGDISGSIVAREITFTGNAAFHYDLALGRLFRHAPYRADAWRTVDDPLAIAERLRLLNP